MRYCDENSFRTKAGDEHTVVPGRLAGRQAVNLNSPAFDANCAFIIQIII